MFYIHQNNCISPQQTFPDVDLDLVIEPANKMLQAREPEYGQIPPGMLRRMGKAVRMGVGAALPLLQQDPKPDGIIIGTTNGGKEDCVKFLNQLIEYDEGMLTPLNFVQGTPNAVASQLGILTGNHGYNITHMHLGLAFENAMIDADMLISEFPDRNYLLGAVDDISAANYYFEDKGGWYKKEDADSRSLYSSGTPGSIAGEASVMFNVNGSKDGALAKIIAVDTLHSTDEGVLKEKIQDFLQTQLPGEGIDILLSGENGDGRLMTFYQTIEDNISEHAAIARYKHMSGEFPTATAMGLWLGCQLLQRKNIPAHMIKKTGSTSNMKNVLLYNNYKKNQHSFILMTLP